MIPAIDAVITPAGKEMLPGFPHAIRKNQHAAMKTAKRKTKSGISHESQSPGVDPHGGWPTPRTMLEAKGIPMPSDTRVPMAAYSRGRRGFGCARITA